MQIFNYIFSILWLFSPGGTSGPITLTQPSTVKALPGDSITLDCVVSGYDINNNHMCWVRQAIGEGLVFIAGFRTGYSTWMANEFKGRVTPSTSGSTAKLRIDALKAEDTCVYYCARVWHHAYFDYWGKGTQVTVTSATATAPSVFPLISISQDLPTTSPLNIGCLVTGFFPQPVSIQWNSGAISTGIHNFPAVLSSSTGLYTTSTHLTIPGSTPEFGEFFCNIGHEATHTTINKLIERPTPCQPSSPEVNLYHSSCDPKSSDTDIVLLCVISGFYPNEVTVEWLVGGKSGLLASHTETPRKDASGCTFSTYSTANITQADWLGGNVYYCQVTHAASQTKVKSRAKRCEGDSGCQSTDITTHIVSPTPKDLYLNRAPKLVCVISNLGGEEGLKVMWSREKAGSLSPEKLHISEDLHGTFTAYSNLPISVESWEEGETFTCTVEYPGLPSPIVKTIAKTTGKTRAPKVYLYRPHREMFIGNSMSQGRSLELICLFRGFFPQSISIQWLKNDNALPEDNYVNTPVTKDNRNDSYSMFSSLTIPNTAWNDGNVYTCMGVHEGLPTKFIQRSVEKSQGTK